MGEDIKKHESKVDECLNEPGIAPGAAYRQTARFALIRLIADLKSEVNNLEKLLAVMPSELEKISPEADAALWDLVLRRRL